MAQIEFWDEEYQKTWDDWVATRPEVIQEMCKSHPADRLYLLKSSGHKVFILSYSENGTVTVVVSGKYNVVDFERKVFGILPEDLEECDLPAPGETLGSVLEDQDLILEYVQEVKDGIEPKTAILKAKVKQDERRAAADNPEIPNLWHESIGKNISSSKKKINYN